MSHKLVGLCTALFLLAFTANDLFAQESCPECETAWDETWLTAVLRVDGRPGFYGTSLLFRVPDAASGDFLFLTNAHTLPTSPEVRDKLQLASPLWRYRWRSVRIVGQAPGYDLAVIAVGRDVEDEERRAEVARTLISDRLGIRADIVGPAHLKLIGVPGFEKHVGAPKPSMQSRLFVREGLESSALPDQNFSTRFDLRVAESCPTILLQRCYIVPFGDWGFSGAIVVALRADQGHTDRKIVGIVSHFTPLAAQMFVIPWSDARVVADAILQAAQDGRALVATLDTNRPLSVTTIGELTVRTPSGDVVFKSSSQTQGGGGEHMGGGGEHMGGGGEHMGGGGEQLKLLRSPEDAIAYLGLKADIVSSISSPETWENPNNIVYRLMAAVPALRGAHAFLAHRPGLERHAGGDRQVIYYADGAPLESLGELVRAYRRNPAAVLSSTIPDVEPPRRLSMLESHVGVSNLAAFAPFVSPAEFDERLRSRRWNWNDTSFEVQGEFYELMRSWRQQDGAVDLIVGKGSPQPATILKHAEWTMDGSTAELVAVDHLDNSIRIELLDINRLEHVGPDAYRYAGKLRFDWDRSMWTDTHWQRTVDGVLTLARNPWQGGYDVKLLCALKDTVTIPSGQIGLLSPEKIYFLGLSALLR